MMSRHRNRRNTIWIGATNDALFYSITLIVFLSQQAVASLVSTLVVGMGYLPMLLPRDGVHYFNDGSSYINNDMRKNDNMINVHFGVGTAFALDTNDGGGKSVSKTTTTTAFARGYPRTDTLIENIAEERNLVVQLDNPIRSVVSQSTTSAPDLKVVMNENQSTHVCQSSNDFTDEEGRIFIDELKSKAEYIDKEFEAINLNSGYSDISLNFDPLSSYSLDIRHINTFLVLPSKNVKTEQKALNEEKKEYITSGTVGTGPGAVKVKIDATRGKIYLK